MCNRSILRPRSVAACAAGLALALAGMAAAGIADAKEGDKGVATGSVVEVGKKGFVLLTDAGERVQLIPQWKGGAPKDGGGLDKEVLRQIQALKPGDKVRVEWLFSEHLRVMKVAKLEAR